MLLVVLGVTTLPPAWSTPTDVPVRAIFDEGMYWAGTPSEVAGVLARAKDAGFNAYIPCVWHGQGATWESAVSPVWDANPSVAKRDAFGVFLKAAHGQGMRVLPCFTLVLRQRAFFPEFTSGSRPDGVFDVQNVDFRQFVRKLVLEFVSRYEVDGINLDYVRAGQVCYDARCQDAYYQATKRNLMLDLASHKVNSTAFGSIVRWQRDAVREMVTSIAMDARKVRPGLVVTVDAAPWADTVLIEGQDSLAWSEAGIVDVVFSMNYERSIDWPAMRELQVGLKNPERFAVMVGNYDAESVGSPVPRPGSVLSALVNKAEGFNRAGHYAVYSYSYLSDDQVRGLSTRSQSPKLSSELSSQ